MASRRSLVPDFVLPLVPIAAAYMVAHYFTLAIIQGQFIIPLVSDPFGRGWDLFGTVDFAPNLAIVTSETVWYVQVGALVIGHVAGLAIAHDRAVVVFHDRRTVARGAAPDARPHGALHADGDVAAYPWLVAHGGVIGAIVESAIALGVVGVLGWAWLRERRRGDEAGVEEDGRHGDRRRQRADPESRQPASDSRDRDAREDQRVSDGP